MVTICGKGLTTVPDLPVVCVAVILILRIDEVTAGDGRGAYIGDIWAYLVFNIRDNALEYFDLNGDHILYEIGVLAENTRLDLIISADERN